MSLFWANGTAQAQTADFGDYNAFSSASSTVVTTLKIGATTDKESAATTNATATGDDTTGTDDEDGVTLPASITGGTANSLTVNVTNSSGLTAYLNVWIDFNRNGLLTDAGEQIAVNTTIATATSNSNRVINFTPPVGASPGTAGVRVRLTSTSSPGPVSVSGNGEVEDGIITIAPNTDFGDYVSFASATQVANSIIRIGTNATDTEAVNPTTGSATIDDTTGTDDEDLTMPAFTVGTGTTLAIPVTVTAASLSGATARLSVFADWNGDNDASDTNETLAVQTVSATGTYNFTLTPPAGTTAGIKYLRIRITEGATSPTFSGASTLKGEVEDYAINVATSDFGDHSLLPGASSMMNATLRLGATVDAEVSATTNAAATGDDTTNTGSADDEDGVNVPASLMQGTSGSLIVNVTNTSGASAYLNAWIDFNGNGVLTDSGEQVAGNTVIATGTSNTNRTVPFNVPALATAGTAGVRVRLTSTSSPGPTGASGNGEVEDYTTSILSGSSVLSRFNIISKNAISVNSSSLSAGRAIANTLSLNSTTMNVGGTASAPDAGTSPLQYSMALQTALTLTSSTIRTYSGSIYLSPSISFTSSNLQYPSGGGSTVTSTSPSPDFSAIYAAMNSESASYASLTANSSAVISGSTYTLQAGATVGTGVAVFNLTVADINSARFVLNANGQNPRAWIVNVSGTGNATFTSTTVGSENQWQDLLFNFHQCAGTVAINSTTMNASVLAPSATISIDSTTKEGSIAGNQININSSTIGFPMWTGDYNGTTVGVGNLIYLDANNDGIYTTGEGVNGVTVQLYKEGDTVGSSTPTATTTTANGGKYLFSGLRGGSYFVHVPASNFNTGGALVGKASVLGTSWLDDADHGGDGASPATSGVSTRLLVLTPGSQPTDTTGETGFDAASDNALDDDINLTVDLGFATPTADYGDFSDFSSASSNMLATLKMGATTDVDSAPTPDATATGDDTVGLDDEDGVTVPSQLMRGSASTLTVNVTNTSGATAYLNVWIDYNRNGVLTDSGEQVAANTVIATGTSNSNKTVNFTVPATATLGTAGIRVRLTSTSSPGATGASGNGEVEDYTVAITPSLGIGNIVWNDANENGLFDPEESGINNVLIELWTPGADNAIGGTAANADTKVASLNTAGGGLFNFSGLAAGYYYVKVPTPPLSRTSLVVDTTDNGQDGDNNAAQPGGSGTSAYSPVIQLSPATEPGSTGIGNIDNTVDFGFASNIGSPFVCDNRFWIVQNAETSAGSGVWDATLYYVGDGPSLVPTFFFDGYKLNGLAAYGGYLYCVDQNDNHLYRINSQGVLVDMGAIAGLPSPGANGQWSGATALTNGRMILNLYNFSPASTQLYTIDLTSATLVGSPVTVTNTGTGTTYGGNFGDIVWDPLTSKVYGYSTVETSWLGLFEINLTTGAATRVASAVPGAWGSMIIDANGLTYGFGSAGASGNQDTLYVFNRTSGSLNGSITAVGTGPAVSNSDGAACPGAAPSMKLGNTVWNDVNNNGLKDAGEAGIDGVTLQLFLGGQNPLTAAPAATVTTAGGGLYSFNNLSPGQYFIYIPTAPASFPLSSASADTADNGQDNDDNGIQTAQGQPITSPLIALAGGTESITDGDTDPNSDLTLDFGFLACPAITVSPTTPAAMTFGSVYTQTFTATGGISPYTWAISAGALPAGLSLNTSTGVVSGTPASGASASFTLRATDSRGCAGTRAYTVTPACTTVSVTTSTLPDAILGTAYSQTLVATGGTGPYTWAITSGTMPAGLTLSSAGVISGTATTANGVGVNVTFRATDALSCQSTKTLAVHVCPTVTVNPITLPAPTVGTAYSQTFTATGGTSPYVYAVATGALPTGLVLNTNTGVISGIPNSNASATFTIRATDANGCQGTRPHNVTPLCPTITVNPATLPNGIAGLAYSQTVSASGGTTPHGFAVVSGSLPSGLSLNPSTGAITGSAVDGTPATFTIRATDNYGCTGTRDYTITPVNSDFGDWNGGGAATAAASTKRTTNIRLGNTVDAEASVIPDAMATADGADDDGVVMPASIAIGSSVTIPVSVFNSNTAGRYLQGWIDFNNDGTFSNADVTGGGERVYNASVPANASSQTVNVTFTVPLNARLGSQCGVRFRFTDNISTTPTSSGANGETEDYVVVISCPAISISPPTLPAAVVGTSYSSNLSASPANSYSWQVVQGSLPSGLSLNSTSGAISGTPTLLGKSDFTVRATTGAASNPELEFTTYNLDLNPGDTFNIRNYVRPKDGTTKPIDWSAVRFTYTDAGANDPTTPANWNLTAFNAGQPVTVTSTDAALGGNSSVGSFRIYIVRDGQSLFDDHMEIRVDSSRTSVVDSAKAIPSIGEACSATRDYSINVCPAITLSPVTWTQPMFGFAYSQTASATGGTAPYVYGIASGSLPAGLSFDSSTGVLSGTPASTTAATFTLTATDANGCVVSRDYTITPLANTDFGDLSTLPNASSTFNSRLKMGALLDTEVSATTNTAATGDDITVSDDEDGVTVPASITAGSTVTIPVVVNNTTGSSAYLNAWIDFGANGDLSNAGDQIATNIVIPNGTNAGTFNVTFTAPVAASVGAGRSVRFRLTDIPTPGFSTSNSVGEIEDYVVAIAAPTLDFGDFNLFPSATSVVNNRLRIGALVDMEGQATTNATATGDDTTGSDDEDGVTVPAAITQGTSTSLTVNVTNTIGATGYLNAWIDFNGNGVLTDAGEQIASNTAIANATSNSNRVVNFTVPAVVKTGTVGVRVRVTSNSSPGPDGQDGSGEVEDITTSIVANTDFGDYSSFPSASSKANGTLRIGALTDSEGGLDTNANAAADDLTGSDDEDGVTVPVSIAQEGASSLTVNLTNTSGSTAYLNAWIDFNRNGVLTDSGEQVAVNTSIVTGTSNASNVINFTAPVAASLGAVGIRVRLTSVTTPGIDGLDGNGEVEDHMTTIVVPTTDFGDELDLANASSTANSNLRLGALVDVEGSPTKTANADGDDTVGQDDEDGLSFPSVTAGQPVTLPVAVTNLTGAAGYLNAWIDFNNNGVLTDAGEQVVTNLLVPAGTNNVTRNLDFGIPTNAVTAATSLGTRFRLTDIQNPGPTGQAGVGEVEDHPIIILAPLTDFGDFNGAPEVSNTASTNLRLGALVDTEYASTRNATASGDDSSGVDDEDGVTLPSMIAGAPATITTVVTNNTGLSAYLNVWIDFNNNGVFTDLGEQVATNTAIANGTSNATRGVNLTVPSTAVTGTNLGVRVRISNDISPGSTGAGGVGEVEDYVINIGAPTTDFGDLTSFGSASSTANGAIRLGALVDTEYTATTNVTASGDDSTAQDDEDGVVFPTMIAGAPVTLPVVVTNTSGASAYLNAWIDFNNNGSIADAGEQVATNVLIATGANNATQNLNFTIPATSLTGVSLGARFRLTSTASPGVSGVSGNGEVEDHLVSIQAPTTDFGDFSGFADASQGVNPALRLGALQDPEFAPTRNAAASGDDTSGVDDEDGVTLPSMTAGQTVDILVSVTNGTGANGFLSLWIDYNNNGVLTDMGEQIATNQIIATGTTNGSLTFTITVPPTATTGVPLGMRARLSAPSGLGPVGNNALAGEIEDYAFTIAAPTTDFGDHSVLAAASSTMNANLLLGAIADAEYAATTNMNATGDDSTGLDDEDGVVVPASLDPGASVTLPVTVKNNTGASAWLHAWIDFNNDGVLNNATLASGGERLEAARLITPATTGTILREYWTGIAGSSVSNLTSSASYPNSPTGSDYRTSFTAPTDWADNMGQRMRGWVYPPVSGEYTFWVSGDDETQLFLSTDATAANAALIARVPTWTSSLAWTTFPEQKSVKITLEAGKPYYIEALMKEGSGGDNLAAAWELPGTSTGPVVIAGQYLAPWSATPPFNSVQQLSFTVPLIVNPGSNRAVRFRLTDSSTTTSTGASGIGEVEDYVAVITSATNDFGDWSGAAVASNGVSSNIFLGARVDAEYLATTNAIATGDDTTDTDDEDGVALPALTAGGSFNVPATVTNLTGAAASLNAWIDFNNNGVFTDTGEQVIVNLAVANGSSGLVLNPSVSVPTTAVTGTNVGVRFRLTTTSTPGATGSGGGAGEVEDYVVNIAAPTADQGDNSRFAAASSTSSNALRMGTLVDAEYIAITNLTASGDDTTGVDDEDGVTLPSLMAGAPATLPVVVTNSTGSTAYLSAWIDFNNNGVLTDSGEQVAASVVVATGTSNATRNLAFTVPPTALTAVSLGVRVRLTSISTASATGQSGTGEVEDYVTTISPPPLDYGDWSGLADAASTVDTGLRLGTLADTEFASTPNATASGDDNTGSDDEDGVTFTAMTAGAPASITVTATNTTASPAYLNAWFDFNNNGSVADAGEQVATNLLVAAGTNNATITLNLTIPASAVTGASLGTRFRLTNLSSPGVTGNVGVGEVEDHPATIAVPVTDFGDWNGAADASNLASSDLRMGALADAEYLPTKNSTATGDDTTASDDEDGVTLSVLMPGTSSSAGVVVTNNSGAAGYLNAWIDFNNNGSFADAGEQIATNLAVAHGTNGVSQNIAFNIPVNAIPGIRGARFRLTAAQNPTSVGAGGLGELEDHMASISCVPFAINPASLPAASVGSAWTQTLTTTGIHSPFIFNVSTGALPAGLALNSATGVISGTPTSSAPASFTITATDANGCTGTRDYTLTPVCPAIGITPVSLAQGTVGTSFNRTLTATGGTLPHSSWTITSGALPAGLSLNASTGVISGTPTAAANPATNIVVRVNDANGCQGTQAISLHICPVVTLSPVSLAASTVGTSYSQPITVSGGVAPHTFAVSSDNLPAGLTLDPNTGVIGGTPTNAISATFTIRATDAHGCSGTRNYTLAPTCPVLVLSPAALPVGYLGASYSATLSISGGTAPHTFTIQSGSLPGGISLSSSGVFSGIPTSVGAYNLVVRATDLYGCTRNFDLTLQVSTLSLGNLVFEDANRNGLKDASELGVSGALVQLFGTGGDNAIGGSGASADFQVGADVTTGSTGAYLFADLPAGNYYVKVTSPVDYLEAGGTASVTDDNINNNNDGSQPGGSGTPLYSPVVNLTGGAESLADDDADADTNLSIDFGLWSSVAVGNFVFIDINGDGVRNEGESLGNIFVELYAEGAVPGVDEPVSVGSSGCSCKGRYYIEGLNPGNYFLHIPASQFVTGMALEGLLPMSVAVPGDDNVGQDLLFNNNPTLNGASTAVFTLRPGLCPVGSAESGGEGTLDDSIDGRVDLTRDLGVVAPAGSGFAAGERARRWLVMDGTSGSVQTNANTFATWSQTHALGGPNDDADEDGAANLLEYALGTDPFSPLQPNRFNLFHDGAAGVVSRITQPVVSRDDLIVHVETLTDITLANDPAAWKTLNLASTTTFNGDDTLTRHYSGLERLLVFKGRDTGFIRLKVSLDADRNGVPEASTATPAHAWSRQTFATGMRTFSMPLMKPAVFTGRVSSVLANEVMLPAILTLPAGSLYLEALDGALVGQRFEIDSALSSGNTLVLHEDGRLLNGLAASRVVIRPHHMLAELLPLAAFTTGDRVLVFDTAINNFTPLVQNGDAWSDGVLSMNTRPFAPHEAVLVDVRGESASLFLTGEVRGADFVIPLVPGAQLNGSGWPAARSAPVTGLRSGATSDTADRLRLWNGDIATEVVGYSGYYLDNSTNPPSWQPQEAATAPLPSLPPFHGFFLIREEPLLLKSVVPW
uniref:GEVED domain-containing protein n=1 Tax=Prosthecobacter sp. TaxID=1965333 RepID=UPI00378343F0